MSDIEPVGPNAASWFTAEANAAAVFSFDDPGDTDRATRGLIVQLDGGRVMLGDHVVFDVAEHVFVSESDEVPDTVHPGLWRQARLNVNHGLFEVADDVWQVRGYDIANITFLAGDDGWLIIDPLTNAPSAAAALDLANRTLGARPVTSIIYTHSHVDHFGGILGVTSPEAVAGATYGSSPRRASWRRWWPSSSSPARSWGAGPPTSSVSSSRPAPGATSTVVWARPWGGPVPI